MRESNKDGHFTVTASFNSFCTKYTRLQYGYGKITCMSKQWQFISSCYTTLLASEFYYIPTAVGCEAEDAFRFPIPNKFSNNFVAIGGRFIGTGAMKFTIFS